MTGREHDTNCTDEPVCPWCGTEFGDGWEWASTDTDADCDDCGKPFHVRPNYSVSYTTTRIEPTPTETNPDA